MARGGRLISHNPTVFFKVSTTLPETNSQFAPEKSMVGTLTINFFLGFGLFSGVMLVSGSVYIYIVFFSQMFTPWMVDSEL